ncbi:hypothetical protein E2C01_003607 [Portunus trituberculatus]|uniref:Uncharacterized protein n=1 Tax=Portunus trituberculatus TaxID=210409 RepID=A0A5B7CQ82_PORTR|nr:hypothetical protein [Portunus trituberculatus]
MAAVKFTLNIKTGLNRSQYTGPLTSSAPLLSDHEAALVAADSVAVRASRQNRREESLAPPTQIPLQAPACRSRSVAMARRTPSHSCLRCLTLRFLFQFSTLFPIPTSVLVTQNITVVEKEVA